MSFSVPTVIRASNDLISELSSPTLLEQKNIVNLLRCANRVQKESFGSETFLIGAAFNKILLPNENIETTQLLASKIPKQWALQASQALSHEATKSVPTNVVHDVDDQSSHLEKVQLSVNDSFVFCSQDKIRVQLSVNNILGILLTAVVEIFNNFIGEDNLFKKSVVLIKLWINFESKRFCYFDLSELFRHDSIVVITMMIFATRSLHQQPEIDNPFAALIYFLEIFSTLNWNICHVTATSIVPNNKSREAVSRNSLPRKQHRPADLYDASAYVSDILQRDEVTSKGERKTAKEELEGLFESYGQFFVANFNVGDVEQGFGESECMENNNIIREDMNSGVDTSSRLRRHTQTMDPSKSDDICVVMVMDPFTEGRNLCGGCSSIFRKKHTSDQLRDVFSRGLQELSAIMDPLLKQDQDTCRSPASNDILSKLEKDITTKIERDLMQTVFHISNTMRLARIAESNADELSGKQGNYISMLYNAFLRNVPPPENSNLSVQSDWQPPEADLNSQEQFMKKLFDIERILFRSVQVASKKVTEESIICLVVQILHQFGPMPIGEIGKQLQVMTRNSEFPKLLKKRFGGLKKFISSHPDSFSCGDNHNFNPVVFAVGYSGPGQLSVITSTPVQYSNNSSGGGGNNQAALAMFAAAVRDLPIEMVQNALAQAAPPSLPRSNNNTTSQTTSPRSLMAATTFPLNPATPNFRGNASFENNLNSGEGGRSERNSWGGPSTSGYRQPNRHFDEVSSKSPSASLHGIARNIHPVLIPPPYEQHDLNSTRNGGLYSRYDPRNTEGRLNENMMGVSAEYGQLSSSPSNNSVHFSVSSPHSNVNMLQYQQQSRSNINNRGLSQQLPPQHLQHHSGYSADILFPNHPSQSQSDQTTLLSRRSYYS